MCMDACGVQGEQSLQTGAAVREIVWPRSEIVENSAKSLGANYECAYGIGVVESHECQQRCAITRLQPDFL